MKARNTIKSIALFCLAVIAMALFSAGRACAADAAYADWLPGVWLGTSRTSNGTFFVVGFTLDKAKLNTASVRFGSPLDCNMGLTSPKQDGDTVVFAITSGSGGKCDRYYGGTAQLKKRPANSQLTFTLKGRSESDNILITLRRNETASRAAPADKIAVSTTTKTQ